MNSPDYMNGKNEIAVALILAQKEMGAAKKGAENPFFKSKYADLSSVIEAIKEPLLNNDIAYSQTLESDDDRNYVRTSLIHKSGQSISGRMLIKPTKDDMQGLGSAITYARRYGLQAITGLPAEDDDGNAASAPKTKATNPDQKDASLKSSVESLAKQVFKSKDEFTKWLEENKFPVELSLATDFSLTQILIKLKEVE